MSKTRVPKVPGLRVTAGEAVQALGSLLKLANAPFAASDAYLLGKTLAALQYHREVIAVDRARVSLCEKYGVKAASGQISVPPDKLADFAAEYSPFAALEIEMDLAPLPLRILDAAPKMTPLEMMALEPFLEKTA